MHDDLVAEYLNLTMPAFVPRHGGIKELPRPQRSNPVFALIGVRHAGKTYYLYQLMDKLMRDGVPRRLLFYFRFDDDRLGDVNDETASKVLDAYFALVPEAAETGCYLFFDGIQAVPNWEGFVCRVAELEQVTMVITGTSSKPFEADGNRLLRERCQPIELWPLSFKEFCDFNGIDSSLEDDAYNPRQQGALSHAFAAYLDTGGFPAAQGMSVTERVQLLQSYVDEILVRDVLEQCGGASTTAGHRFALVALRSTGQQLSVNRELGIMRGMGVSMSNENAYGLLDGFEDTHLAFKVMGYRRTAGTNPRASYKVYAVDPGLSVAVSPPNLVSLDQRLETVVYLELRRRLAGARGHTIARYTTRRRREVAFIAGGLPSDGSYELIQPVVEIGMAQPGSGATPSKRLKSVLATLESAMAETRLTSSTIITLGEEEFEIAVGRRTIRVIPAWKWCLTAPPTL